MGICLSSVDIYADKRLKSPRVSAYFLALQAKKVSYSIVKQVLGNEEEEEDKMKKGEHA